jgi:ribosomal protein S18 acetylase RimI-like enzyme
MHLPDIQITGMGIADIPLLQTLGRTTFEETFAASNTTENLQQYLEEAFTTELLTTEINNPGSAFYMAWLDQQAIGYLKINYGTAQTELQDDKGFEIERIYVLQAFHGKHIGQILFDKAIEIAQARSANYVWLGVWEDNKRAIRFYEKNGFVPFDKHIFMVGGDAQTDIMMKRVL